MSKRITDLTAATTLASDDLLPIVDVSDTTQAATGTTKKVTRLLLLDNDGWQPANETWTYVSATSFKITSTDVRTKYPKGTKVKMTNSTVKYGWVSTNSTMSGSDTLVTLAANSDYPLTNTTISSPYYSYVDVPQGFPDWKSTHCQAYLGSNQVNITNTTWTLVEIDTEEYDIGSCFSTSTHLWTCPLTAFYTVSANVSWVNGSLAADKLVYVTFRQNTDSVSTTVVHTSTTARVREGTSKSVKITSGQTISVYAYHSCGVDTPDIEGGGNELTYLSISFLHI